MSGVEELLGTLIEESRLTRETMQGMWRDLSSGLAAVKKEVALLKGEVGSTNRRLDILTETVRHSAAINDQYEERITLLEARVNRLEQERG